MAKLKILLDNEDHMTDTEEIMELAYGQNRLKIEEFIHNIDEDAEIDFESFCPGSDLLGDMDITISVVYKGIEIYLILEKE